MNQVLNIVFPPDPEFREEREKLREAPQAPPSVVPDRLQDDVDAAATGVWEADQFARRQLSQLVQHVFFPGWPRPSRQIVVSSVDQLARSAEVCARIAHAMAKDLPGTVCAVEAALVSPGLEQYMAPESQSQAEKVGAVHPNCVRVHENLWLLTLNAFLRAGYDHAKVVWLRSRLSELRREFDYTIIHAAAISVSSDVMLLGQLSDGVILVLEAHSTRRAAARSARESLYDANVRLLGLVLNQRTFPVPEAIYSKL
ncbi:MAG: hypothetical protein DMG68_02390 [Acidobacteria bacterium]|nr:MAG: hypothetical protein DMG68_02390 [Acidobacteriota bacterium]